MLYLNWNFFVGALYDIVYVTHAYIQPCQIYPIHASLYHYVAHAYAAMACQMYPTVLVIMSAMLQ